MVTVKKALPFAVLMMTLIYLSLSILPGSPGIGLHIAVSGAGADSPAGCYELEGSDAYECLIGLAVRANNPEICSHIDNVFYSDRCYSETLRGETLCEALGTSELRGSCFARVAVESGDYGLCSRAAAPGVPSDGTSDRCFFEYAVSSGDRTGCAQIGNEERQGDCLYRLSGGSVEGCDGSSKESEEWCMLRLAVETRNPSLCIRLSQGMADECNLQTALATGDGGLCERITNLELKNMCLGQG
jgi:hypothetical protein